MAVEKVLLSTLKPWERSLLRKGEAIAWRDPMLATLTEKRFSSPDWLYEPKFDGERALVFRQGQDIRLLSRNQHLLNTTYPELTEALLKQPCSQFIIDGEIVAFEREVTSFARLQQRLGLKGGPSSLQNQVEVYFYVFDIIHLGGYDLEYLPLTTRKKLLESALLFNDLLRYTVHCEEQGEAYYQEACRKGWEGVIAKKADAIYEHKRSQNWLKFKCVKGQELVIGGYTAPQGNRQEFGALLVGYYKNGTLMYAGKVGTGFDFTLLKTLKKEMDNHKITANPFGEEIRGKGITWIKPVLVGQIGFTEWTRAGKLRHPRFIGLRFDKEAQDVVREVEDAV